MAGETSFSPVWSDIYPGTLKGNRTQHYDAEPALHMSQSLTSFAVPNFSSLTALSEITTHYSSLFP